MEQYVTYKINQDKYKNLNPISNELDFITSGGHSGVKDYNLLYQKTTETRLIDVDLNKLKNSKSFKFIQNSAVERRLLAEIYNIEEFLESIPDKASMYDRFSIPKRSGGLRWIDAPKPELARVQEAQRFILEYTLKLLGHNCAHAYTKERSIATNARFHMNSNHFARIDFANFFGSITSEMLLEVLPKIGLFAYSRLPETSRAFQGYLEQLVELATLKGSLPQGTKISPLLSNLIMIPFDYHLTEILKEQDTAILYTRYADDLMFSSFYAFADRKEDAKERLEGLVNEAISRAYNQPYITIKPEKTSISTKYGKNRLVGVKVNANNDISIGYKEKRKLKQDLARMIMAKQNESMNDSEMAAIVGYYNFLNAIEPDYARYVLTTLERKFNLNQPVIQFLTT